MLPNEGLGLVLARRDGSYAKNTHKEWGLKLSKKKGLS
jgi:hypothetical protein